MANPTSNFSNDLNDNNSKPMRIVKSLGGAMDKFIGSKLAAYEKRIDKILRETKKIAGGSGSGVGGGNLGMGSVSSPAGSTGGSRIGLGSIFGSRDPYASTGIITGPGPVRVEPRQSITAGQIGLGLGKVAAGAAAFAYGMLPDTDAAVTQNLLATSLSTVSGGSVQSIVNSTNRMVGGGITGAYSAQEAAAGILYNGGYALGSVTANRLLKSTGGFSVMTGMDNASVASAAAGINGMSMLKLGIQARDKKGNLLPPEQIASQLYNRMYGGRKISVETASAVFNPTSVAYANTMAAAGNDPALFNMLATYQVQKAKNGGKDIDMKDSKAVLKAMGVKEDSPYAMNFKYQQSEAGKLQKTGGSQVEGYTGAMDAVTRVNEQFNQLSGPLDAVVQGMSKLAGVLEGLPGMGNTGGTIAGFGGAAASAAGSLASNFLMYKGMQQGINAFRAARGLPAAANVAGTAAKGGSLLSGLSSSLLGGKALASKIPGLTGLMNTAKTAMPWAAKALPFAARALPGLGAAYTLWDTHNVGVADRATGWDWGNFFESAASGTISGATMGGPWGALAGGIINAANYGLSYAGLGGGDDSGATAANAYYGEVGGPDGATEGKGASGNKGGKYRSPREAAQWALQQVRKGTKGWKGLCERFARTAYNYPAKYPSAADHWRDAVRTGRAHRGGTPPVGAFVLWTGGSSGYGHAAISLGGGKVVSTDIKRPGQADVTTIAHINKVWSNLSYQGWADPRHMKIKGDSPPIDATGASITSTDNAPTNHMPKARQAMGRYVYSSRADTGDAAGPSVGLSSGAIFSSAFGSVGSSASVTIGDLLGMEGAGGPGATSTSEGGSGRSYTVNMNVNIARATNEDAMRLAKQVRNYLENESAMERIGSF